MTRRFVAAFVGLTVVILLILIIPLGITTARREREDLTLSLERDARVLGALAEDTLEGLETRDLQTPADQYEERTGSRVVIVDADGRLIADSEPLEEAGAADDRSFADRPEVMAALDGRVSTGSRFSDTLQTSIFFVSVPVSSGGEIHGAVRLTYPSAEVDEQVRRAWLTLVGVGLVSLAAAGSLGWVLARSVTAPLRRLQHTASELGSGRLSARSDIDSGPPEVRSLGEDFNDMAERIEELVATQDAFVADASHQLRTPLTALRLRLENLEADAESDSGLADEVEAAQSEVSRLTRLVGGLLTLAKADRRAAGTGAGTVDIGALLRERVDAWQPVGNERSVTLTIDGPADVAASGSHDGLSQAFDNLIHNALEVSPEGASVRLVVAAEAEAVVIHVIDEGPGMDAENRDRAFDRFWQGRADTGSTGLGLAIVRKLVRADGGSVRLDEAPGGGIDAVVTLKEPPG